MAELALISGLGLSAAGSIAGGVAAKRQSDFESDVLKQNAIAEQERSAAEEQRLRRDQSKQAGRTRAAFGASGVRLEGTPLDVLADDAMIAEENALLTRFGGDTRAAGLRAQSSAAKRRGRGQLLSGLARGGGTLLTGASELL